jgi:deoxyribonuclease V
MDYYRLHPWRTDTKTARNIQKMLRKRLVPGKPLKKVSLIAACDVGYLDSKAIAVVAVFEFPSLKLVEEKISKGRVQFPYVPGLLTFREGPLLLKAFSKIKNEPDVILFDGQGIAHPIGMGEATHMGILLDRPTIGCAKSRLFGMFRKPKKKRGSYSYLFTKAGIVGAVLRTRDNTKPIFLSPGFKIDLRSSIDIVLKCSRYRIPEPLRYTHRRTQELKRKNA